MGLCQQAPFAAPGMQQVPQYAAMGYGQYPYMNVAPHYGMQSAYFPQHPGGYGGYPAQVISIRTTRHGGILLFYPYQRHRFS